MRLRVRLYIAAVALSVLALMTYTVSFHAPLTTAELVIALIFVLFVAVVNIFPLEVAHKHRLSLDTTVIFAAVLLFDPLVAMLIAGVGSFLGDVLRNRLREWHHEIGFNTSQAMLQAGLAALVLASTGWDTDLLLSQPPRQLMMIVVAAGTMHLVNTVLVATVVSLEVRRSPLAVWKQSARLISTQQLSEFMLGVLGAVIVHSNTVALPLLLFPTLALYHSLERHIQLRRQTVEAVEALADMVDIRDPYTANHSRRVAQYARELAVALNLTPDDADLIEQAARVHDIGKVIVDRSVLTKYGPLSEEDWAQLRQHPITGAEILGRFPTFTRATSYVRSHHERMDGKGYPDQLEGHQIPLGARIIAVADAYDVMTTARPYRAELPPHVVMEELAKYRGSQWDPCVVDALLGMVKHGQLAYVSRIQHSTPQISLSPGS